MNHARVLPVLLCAALLGGALSGPAYAADPPGPDAPASPSPTASTTPSTPSATSSDSPAPAATSDAPPATDSPGGAATATTQQDTDQDTDQATEAAPAVILTAGPRVRLDRTGTLTATLTGEEGRSVPDREVAFQRKVGTSWATVTTSPVGTDGTATASVRPTGTATVFRAHLVQSGVDSAQATLTAYAAATRVTLSGPSSVVDERSVRLNVTMTTTDDASGVPARATLQRRVGTGAWRGYAATTLSAGRGGFTLRPRSTASYRVVGAGGAWWNGATSAPLTVRNVAPGTVVHLPKGAPHPRSMAPQPRATAAGAAVRVTRISDAQWRRMRGVSWHRGCPVGRAGLRSVELNYWAFDGYRRRGRLVVNAHAVRQYAAAFTRLYAAKVPLRRVYPSETFGYGRRSHGANDFLAMRSDNTSAFNCRWVTGRPHVMSPHSTGYAVDINTFENPYLTRAGWLPNSWWPGRSFGLIAWRTQSATVVSIMRRSGFAWTYGVKDSQHFDVRR